MHGVYSFVNGPPFHHSVCFVLRKTKQIIFEFVKTRQLYISLAKKFKKQDLSSSDHLWRDSWEM